MEFSPGFILTVPAHIWFNHDKSANVLLFHWLDSWRASRYSSTVWYFALNSDWSSQKRDISAFPSVYRNVCVHCSLAYCKGFNLVQNIYLASTRSYVAIGLIFCHQDCWSGLLTREIKTDQHSLADGGFNSLSLEEFQDFLQKWVLKLFSVFTVLC